MYLPYWQLTARPFENCTDARFYYPSEVHQGALLKLRYAIESRRGAALLAGGAGMGKSLLVNTLHRQLNETFTPFVHLVFPQLKPNELLAYLAAELGVLPNPQVVATPDEVVRRLQHTLIENARRGYHAVLAVDEAQLLLANETLETLRLLLNFEADGHSALTLLLVGQPTLLPVLERMPGLEARLNVKCLLRPFNLEETVSYVNHRLTSAGATQEIFTSEALATLHQLSGGVPRKINRLCDLALLIGFAEEQLRINAPQIEAVCNELVTVAPE